MGPEPVPTALRRRLNSPGVSPHGADAERKAGTFRLGYLAGAFGLR